MRPRGWETLFLLGLDLPGFSFAAPTSYRLWSMPIRNGRRKTPVDQDERWTMRSQHQCVKILFQRFFHKVSRKKNNLTKRFLLFVQIFELKKSIPFVFFFTFKLFAKLIQETKKGYSFRSLWIVASVTNEEENIFFQTFQNCFCCYCYKGKLN